MANLLKVTDEPLVENSSLRYIFIYDGDKTVATSYRKGTVNIISESFTLIYWQSKNIGTPIKWCTITDVAHGYANVLPATPEQIEEQRIKDIPRFEGEVKPTSQANARYPRNMIPIDIENHKLISKIDLGASFKKLLEKEIAENEGNFLLIDDVKEWYTDNFEGTGND